MGILGAIAASLANPAVILGGLVLAGILWLQPPKWAWRILGAFVLWDCVILASRWSPIVRSPHGYPAPEDMGMLEQVDVDRAGVHLAAAILIAAAVLAARALTTRTSP